MTSNPGYLMGNSDAEFARLRLQADYLEPVTRRLLDEAGIGPGMRVLDLGCGVGDVSLLLAEVVGSSEQVVAVDRDARALATARARTAGHGQIEFILADDESLTADRLFDAVVGRYVLFHQLDPIAMVRRAAALVRPGGVVAFHEMVTSIEAHATPPLDLWTLTAELAFGAARAGLLSPDVGGRLAPILEYAGLPAPRLFCECVAGGPDSLAVPWLVMSCRALAPVMDRLSVDRSGLGDLDTLEDRLTVAARRARTWFILNPQACAWAVRP